MHLTLPNPTQEAPAEKLEREAVGARAASPDQAEGATREGYAVRWLRGHYALTPAAAKIIAAEFGWLEAA